MKNILQHIFIVLGLFVTPVIINAQMATVSTDAPLFVPPSPTASSLAMFADYPVSHYTGVPSINIPIYEINVDDYKLPITLSYHSSGIRVAQEASWVGLGWALSAGGAISRTVKCIDDFSEFGGFGPIMRGYYTGPEISYANIEDHFSIDELKVDSEPDIFTFNLPHASGKFLIDKSRGAVLLDNSSNLKIDITKSTTYGYYFTITTPEGIQYILDRKEKTENHTKPGYLYSETDDNDVSKYVDFQCYNSTWYLSKIILPNKKEITFSYETEVYSSPAQESCTMYRLRDFGGTFSENCELGTPTQNIAKYSRSKQEVFTLRLTKITWDSGYIDFIGSNRLDMRTPSKYYSLQKLDEIKIYGNIAGLIKNFQFTYNYFDNSLNSGKDYLYKRLRLDAIKEVGVGDYKMSYQGGSLPSKNSTNTDYWGYHNGKDYGKEHQTQILFESKTYAGAIKTSDLNYLLTGTLTQISFPTGGYNTFTYEENTFDNKVFDSSVGISITTGGGLRIKQIVSGGTNTTLKTRNFKYSGGRAIMPPCLFYFSHFVCQITNGQSGYKNYLVQSSTSSTPLSSLRSGNTVGYDMVEESLTDEESTQIVRYSFHNDIENPHSGGSPFVSPDINYYNGLPQSVTYLYKDNKINKEYQTKKVLFEYTSFAAGYVKAFYYTKQMTSLAKYEYSIEWVKKIYETTLTAKSTEGSSSLSETSESNIVEGKYFSYNDLNKQVNLVCTNNNYVQKVFFPQDFTDAVSVGMVGKHMINTPVESISMDNTTVISGEKVDYKYETASGMYVPNIIHRLAPPSPLTIDNYRSYFVPKIYFDKYNSKGKPLQVRTDEGSVIYIWGYKNQYPIAEIKNVTFSQITPIISEATLETIANQDEPTAANWTLINNLRGNELLKDAHITTFKYKPLVGVSEITTPNELVTYYDYDTNGRLYEIYFKEDGVKRILEQNEYKYAGQ